jgi:thiol-disulfide isomerase/thioredoxin
MRGFAVVLIAAVATAAAGRAADEQAQRRPFPPIQIFDAKGAGASITSVLGRATIVNFWATWCGPCRIELPELQQLYNDLAGKGVAMVAINVDSPREQVAPFLKRANLTLPVYFLDDETEASIGVRSLPTTVLLDSEGKVVNVWGGYSREGIAELRRQAESLVAGPSGRGDK